MYLSNFLETLTTLLLDVLYEKGSNPCTTRLIIIPDISLKDFLTQKIAQDPRFQVAAGIEWRTLSQALGLPTFLELSLFLEIEILEKISTREFCPVLEYIEGPSRDRRFSQFIDQLTSLFLRYGKYGRGSSLRFSKNQMWQSILWEEVGKRWPSVSLEHEQIYLFGFGFLPKFLLDWFLKQGADFYFFSPCQTFWGDYYSEKERVWIKKGQPSNSWQEYEETFQDQNRMLANWGRLGRKMHNELLDYQVQEHYSYPNNERGLSALQKQILLGEKIEQIPKDCSLQIWTASTRWEEIELLKSKIKEWLHEGVAPCDIQVFAPDISLYFPYIRTVFADHQIEIAVEDIPSQFVDPFLQAFEHLLALLEENFTYSALFALFSFPMVQEKFRFTKAELTQMQEWCMQGHIHSWEEDLKRYLLESTQKEGLIEQSQLECFNTFYCAVTSLLTLLTKEPRSITDWADSFISWSKTYFAGDFHEPFFQQLHRIKKTFQNYSTRISYESARRIFTYFLKKRTRLQAPHLQAVRFSSLPQGVVWPSSVICLIGMQEEGFPRLQQHLSLAASLDSPLQSEEDRYLFLQFLCSARKFFFISYPKQLPGEIGDVLAALPVRELIQEMHLTPSSFHPKRENREPIAFTSSSKIELPRNLDLKKLSKLVKDPEKFFLNEALGIYDQPDIDESEEFVLSPLKKYLLCKEAVKTPLKALLERAEKQRELPSHSFKEVAIKKVTEEYEKQIAHLEKMEISPQEIFSIVCTHTCKEKEKLPSGDWIFPPHKFILENDKEIELVGKIEEITSKGLLLRSEGTLIDQIKAWPLYLLYQVLFSEGGKEFLFLKKAKRCYLKEKEAQKRLHYLLEYYQEALQTSSPLTPEAIEAVLLGNPIELEEKWRDWVLKIFQSLGKNHCD